MIAQLGDAYDGGFGVAKNTARAAECYTKAAGLNSFAMVKLADMYAGDGPNGVDQDLEKAFKFYKAAAE